MNFSQIWNTANNVASYILGNTREYRTVVLSSGEERFTLPVTPWRYQVQTAQDNHLVDILDSGERLIFGNPKLKRLKFKCFFPAVKHHYAFVVGDVKETSECIALLEKWKENKSPVKIIITDSTVNLQMSIMNFNYEEKDGSRDIYYDLDFTEYKDWNVPQSNNDKVIDTLSGLKDRPNTDRTIQQISSFVEKSRDILEASKNAYGIWSELPKFANVNNVKNFAARGISSVIKSGGWKW
mgnify:CR=1 FL=1